MKIKFIASILTAALAISALTACGGSDTASAPAADSEAVTETPAAAETEEAADRKSVV